LKHYYKSFFNFLNVRGSSACHRVLADQHSDESSGIPKKFSVGVWNTFKGGARGFDQDFLKIYENHDILCFQEVLMNDGSFWELDTRLRNFVFASSYQRRDQLFEGVMSLANTAALDTYYQVPSQRTEPFLNTPKTSLVTDYAFNNRSEKLRVINSHAILFRRLSSFDSEIRNLVDHISSHSGPAIMCGDFNTITSRYYHVLAEQLLKLGFRPAVLENEFRKKHKSLDHIFYRDLKLIEAKIDTEIKGSDHPFLRAIFEL